MDIWFYEQTLPEGIKNYTKTRPMQFDEFAPLLEWWDTRVENEHAWKVHVDNVLKYDEAGNLLLVDLDIKNPNTRDDIKHLPPEKIVEDIINRERQIAMLLDDVMALLKKGIE